MRGDLFTDDHNLFDTATVARAGLVYEGIGRSLVRQRVDSWA